MLKVIQKEQNRISLLLLFSILSILILFHFILPELFAQNEISDSIKNIENNDSEMEQNSGISLKEIAEYAELINIFVQIAIIVLLAKLVKDSSALARVSKLQTEVRFRPWIGPHGGIEFMGSNNNDNNHKDAIKLKNFGEISATNVIAFSRISDAVMKKDEVIRLKKLDYSENHNKKYGVGNFNIGPLLPGMEKRYWILINEELLKRAKEGTSNLYILFYFSYDFSGETSGYGMITQFDKNSHSFVHNEMWID